VNWPECLVRHTHQPRTWLEDPATQKTGIRLHPCEPIRPTIHHLPANRTRPTTTHSPTHTHRSTPAPRKCGLRALVPLTNQPALSFSLTCSISFAFHQNISIFPGTFRRCPKAKSRAKSYAHASADSFFLHVLQSSSVLAVGFLERGVRFLYDSGISFFSCEPLSLFVLFLHCMAMVTLGRILFDMVAFQRDHETRGHEQ
jgi:hypothetical protein